MGVERKDIPQKHGTSKPGDHAPDNGRGTLGNRRADGGASERDASKSGSQSIEVGFISKWQAGATATAVA